MTLLRSLVLRKASVHETTPTDDIRNINWQLPRISKEYNVLYS